MGEKYRNCKEQWIRPWKCWSSHEELEAGERQGPWIIQPSICAPSHQQVKSITCVFRSLNKMMMVIYHSLALVATMFEIYELPGRGGAHF